MRTYTKAMMRSGEEINETLCNKEVEIPNVPNENKHNLLYFEGDSMKDLYETMEKWQKTNGKRLLSTNIQKDKEKFCCIALSNPMEVIISSGTYLGSLGNQARVNDKGELYVFSRK